MSFLELVIMCFAFLTFALGLWFVSTGAWAFASAFFGLSLIGDVVWFNYLMERENGNIK